MKKLLHLNDEALDKISGGPEAVVEHGPVNFLYESGQHPGAPIEITFDNDPFRIITPGPDLGRRV